MTVQERNNRVTKAVSGDRECMNIRWSRGRSDGPQLWKAAIINTR